MRDLSLSACSLLVCLILGFGCRDQDKIVRYRVPKQKSTSTADTQEMLVAVTERNGEVYFFKTVGPSDRMDQCRDAVKTLCQNNPISCERQRASIVATSRRLVRTKGIGDAYRNASP